MPEGFAELTNSGTISPAFPEEVIILGNCLFDVDLTLPPALSLQSQEAAGCSADLPDHHWQSRLHRLMKQRVIRAPKPNHEAPEDRRTLALGMPMSGDISVVLHRVQRTPGL
jgi:hypothetical protein